MPALRQILRTTVQGIPKYIRYTTWAATIVGAAAFILLYNYHEPTREEVNAKAGVLLAVVESAATSVWWNTSLAVIVIFFFFFCAWRVGKKVERTEAERKEAIDEVNVVLRETTRLPFLYAELELYQHVPVNDHVRQASDKLNELKTTLDEWKSGDGDYEARDISGRVNAVRQEFRVLTHAVSRAENIEVPPKPTVGLVPTGTSRTVIAAENKKYVEELVEFFRCGCSRLSELRELIEDNDEECQRIRCEIKQEMELLRRRGNGTR